MPKLSTQISDAIEVATAKDMTLGEFVDSLSVSSHMLPVLILTAPFFPPIPIPFLSSAAGILTIFLGISIFLGIEPWVPAKVANRPLSKNLTLRSLNALARVARFLEGFCYPRIFFISKQPLIYRLNGFILLICGLIFMTPLPPFGHMPTAFTIALLAIGDLEDDGLIMLLAYGLFILKISFLVFLFTTGAEWLASLDLPNWMSF